MINWILFVFYVSYVACFNENISYLNHSLTYENGLYTGCNLTIIKGMMPGNSAMVTFRNVSLRRCNFIFIDTYTRLYIYDSSININILAVGDTHIYFSFTNTVFEETLLNLTRYISKTTPTFIVGFYNCSISDSIFDTNMRPIISFKKSNIHNMMTEFAKGIDMTVLDSNISSSLFYVSPSGNDIIHTSSSILKNTYIDVIYRENSIIKIDIETYIGKMCKYINIEYPFQMNKTYFKKYIEKCPKTNTTTSSISRTLVLDKTYTSTVNESSTYSMTITTPTISLIVSPTISNIASSSRSLIGTISSTISRTISLYNIFILPAPVEKKTIRENTETRAIATIGVTAASAISPSVKAQLSKTESVISLADSVKYDTDEIDIFDYPITIKNKNYTVLTFSVAILLLILIVHKLLNFGSTIMCKIYGFLFSIIYGYFFAQLFRDSIALAFILDNKICPVISILINIFCISYLIFLVNFIGEKYANFDILFDSFVGSAAKPFEILSKNYCIFDIVCTIIFSAIEAFHIAMNIGIFAIYVCIAINFIQLVYLVFYKPYNNMIETITFSIKTFLQFLVSISVSSREIDYVKYMQTIIYMYSFVDILLLAIMLIKTKMEERSSRKKISEIDQCLVVETNPLDLEDDDL